MAQAVDASVIPFTVSARETIVVVAAGSPLSVVGGNPPSGTVGVAYMTALTATGGTQPYTWSIFGGALPAGLTLSATSGVISGKPLTSSALLQFRQAIPGTAAAESQQGCGVLG